MRLQFVNIMEVKLNLHLALVEIVELHGVSIDVSAVLDFKTIRFHVLEVLPLVGLSLLDMTLLSNTLNLVFNQVC